MFAALECGRRRSAVAVDLCPLRAFGCPRNIHVASPRRGRDPPRRPCNASSFLRRKSEPKLAGTGASTFHDVAVARAAYQQQWSDNRTEYFAYRPADKPPRPMIAPALCRDLWYPTNSTVRYEPHAFGHPNTFRGDEAALSPT